MIKIHDAVDSLEKELAFMKEQNIALERQVCDSNALKEDAIKKATVIQSKYDELYHEMTIIAAEKKTIGDALKESVKKCEGIETSLARFMADPCNEFVIDTPEEEEFVIAGVIDTPEEEKFVEPVGVVRVMWKEHYFYMDDDGNLYEPKHEYKLDAKPIGKWNAETKTCSWYVKMLFEKQPAAKPMRLRLE